MFVYEKRLQYPVKIDSPNPKLAALIISQYGGPNIRKLSVNLRFENCSKVHGTPINNGVPCTSLQKMENSPQSKHHKEVCLFAEAASKSCWF